MTDQQQTGQTGELGLTEMVTGLRHELEEAQRRAQGEKLQFSITDVEVEAAVQITRNAAGKAGIQFWVLQAGGEVARGDATTHRIMLHLKLPPSTLIADEEADVG